MQQFALLLFFLIGIPTIASVVGFIVALIYLKLRLPTSTRRAQQLRHYNLKAREALLQIRPLLTLDPANEQPLNELDSQSLALFLEVKPLLQHLHEILLPELQQVWQVRIDSQLLIPPRVIERISTLEAARKKIDESYAVYLEDRETLRRLIKLQRKYVQLQDVINADLQRQRNLIDGVLERLEAARLPNLQEFFDVEMQIERLSDSLREVEALFAFESLAADAEGIHRFRHAFDLMYPRLLFFDEMLPKLNYRLHQLVRAQRYLLREQSRLADLNDTIQQQLMRAESRKIEVADLWQKYQAAQDNLERAQKAFNRRSTETYISMAGSLTQRGDVNDTRLKLISAELHNILNETRTRLSTTVQLEHLNEAIQLLGDLHEEVLGLAQIEDRPLYKNYLATITDLSLEFERRRETLEDKRNREQPDAAEIERIPE